MNILGIDPGADGALAILYPDRALAVYRFKDKTPRDIWRLFFEESLAPCRAYVEDPGRGRPKQNPNAVHMLGYARGLANMALAASGIPHEIVQPLKWQQGVGVAGQRLEYAERKKAFRAKAQQLFPAYDIPLAAADAVLIAEYGWRVTHGRLK